MSTATLNITTKVLRRFDDPLLSFHWWSRLLSSGETDTVFLTWSWQRAWWDVFGRGQLLLAFVERNGEPVAVAPLFCDAGMVFFVGSGGSDYVDFVGDTSEEGVLDALLDAARSAAKDFVGFRFYQVPDRSRTPGRLQRAAEALGLAFFEEGKLAAPVLEIPHAAAALAAANMKSLLRHERGLAKSGTLNTRHMHEPATMRRYLNDFFQQH